MLTFSSIVSLDMSKIPNSIFLSVCLRDPSIPLCSDWSLQLVSIGYGRAHQSEFLLIVSREVKGEESALPNNSGEVCPTNSCPWAAHCMVPVLSSTSCRPMSVSSRHSCSSLLSLYFGLFCLFKLGQHNHCFLSAFLLYCFSYFTYTHGSNVSNLNVFLVCFALM